MGGVLVHIKAFKPHPIPHQSDVSTEDIWGQYASTALCLGLIVLHVCSLEDDSCSTL